MPPQNQPTPPGDAFQSRAGAGHSTRLFVILIIALVVIAGAGWYLLGKLPGSPLSADTVTFVAAHSAATFAVSGSHLGGSGDKVEKLGPATAADGTQYVSVLAMAPLPPKVPGQDSPVIVTPPQPVWLFYRGANVSASSSLGVGRPLGTMADGTLLAITTNGLEALVPGGSVSITSSSKNLIAAANADATIVAFRNDVSRATDVYAIAPKSFQKTFLGTINGDPLALAFDAKGSLFVIATTSSVSEYSVSATAAPTLIATSTLANPWP